MGPVAVTILWAVFVAVSVEAYRAASQSATVQRVKVVIVGGGVSSIAAGTKLLENGIDDFVILEAQDYYGGRINTVRFGDEYVDLGAQWVHGEEGNAVFNLANPHDLIEQDQFTEVFIEPSGTRLSDSTVEEITDILDAITDAAYKNSQNYTDSLGKFFTEEFPKKLKEKSLSSSPVMEEILDWYQKELNVDDAADTWFQTSVQDYAVYEKLQGHQQWGWKSGGYATVLDLLMKKIPDASKELPIMNKIYRNFEVVKIKWSNLHEDRKDNVIVKCKDGGIYIADYVLVTVSLGVLKGRHASMFKPALPQSKVNAIQGLSYGVVDKIFLEFPSKWWPDNFTEFEILWEGDDACKNTILNSTDKAELDNCWDHFVYSLHEVRNQPRVLCGWLYGAAARHMETLTDMEVGDKVTALLQKFVGTAFNVAVPAPTRVLRSDWFSNPFFRGSYSFRSMETEARGASAAHLAEPLLNNNGKPVVFFAGEATHSSHFSTVHGAIESGWREAERIIQLLT